MKNLLLIIAAVTLLASCSSKNYQVTWCDQGMIHYNFNGVVRSVENINDTILFVGDLAPTSTDVKFLDF